MFYTLLLVTFVLSFIVTFGVVHAFKKPITLIFNRIIKDPISAVWEKYISFAAYVVGISGGVRIYQLERYIIPAKDDAEVLVLTHERWVIEVYRTIIATLQSLAWMYLLVFIVALIAYVIVRGSESKHKKETTEQNE
jgi:hypothetical protein